MKRLVLGCLVLLAGTICVSAARAQILFVASLDGSQETPPNTNHAKGTAWAVLSADMTTLTYGVTYAGLSAPFTASHFHVGVPGVPGPVVQPFPALRATPQQERGQGCRIPS